jgi:hypothetical protein
MLYRVFPRIWQALFLPVVFDFKFKPIFANAHVVSKNENYFRTDQNGLKNNHFAIPEPEI